MQGYLVYTSAVYHLRQRRGLLPLPFSPLPSLRLHFSTRQHLLLITRYIVIVIIIVMEVPLQVNLTIVGARDLPKTDFFSDIDPCTYSSPPLSSSPSSPLHQLTTSHSPSSPITPHSITIDIHHSHPSHHHTTPLSYPLSPALPSLLSPLHHTHSLTLTHTPPHSLTLSDVTVTVAGGSHGKTEVMDNNANPTWDHELILLLNYNPTSHSLPTILFELWDKNSKSKDEKVYTNIYTYINEQGKEKEKKQFKLHQIIHYTTLHYTIYFNFYFNFNFNIIY